MYNLYETKYNIEEIAKVVRKMRHICYYPSGKEYEFSLGKDKTTTCGDEGLEFTLLRLLHENKLVEIDHVKKEEE